MTRLAALLWLDCVALFVACGTRAGRGPMVLFSVALIFTAAAALYYTRGRP